MLLNINNKKETFSSKSQSFFHRLYFLSQFPEILWVHYQKSPQRTPKKTRTVLKVWLIIFIIKYTLLIIEYQQDGWQIGYAVELNGVGIERMVHDNVVDADTDSGK